MKLQVAFRWFGFSLLSLFSIVMLFPFIWMLSNSLKSVDQVYMFPPTLIPQVFRWENYMEIWKLAPLGRYLFNSLFTASITIVIQLLLIIPASYAFARLRFKGSGFLFLLVLATMMIPDQVTFIPNFLTIKQLGWVDTYMGLIAPFTVKAFGIFMLRQAFMQVPKELEEAAILDGCGHTRIMRHLMMPLSGAAVVTYILLSFIWNYNELFWPLIVTNNESLRTVQLGLSRFMEEGGGGSGGTQWNLVMAAAAVIIAPLVVIFISMQKFIVKGVATTGLK
ncbi:carbohydrate ABC transporter permease [Paenibacillus pabuli]|uniref:carbohydrate ABC transporter permease n=1 Tax=Paenibacillus pabuli TaxID=1472 RepID=UPI001FFEC225|nr:carbohydrate ABC transporter permease [Paenibacillus pabuli]